MASFDNVLGYPGCCPRCMRQVYRAVPLFAAVLILAGVTFTAALAEPVMLYCKLHPGSSWMQKLGWNGQYSGFDMKVDAQAGTITYFNNPPHGFCAHPIDADRLPVTLTATYTETQITWDWINGNGIEFDCSLSRLNGYFVYSWIDPNNGPLDWEGPCVKVKQQF